MNKTSRIRYLRRSMQFSMRTLLILVTLCGIGTGVYVGYVVPHKRQYQAGLELSKKGVSLEWRAAEPAWLTAPLRVFVDDAVLNECTCVHAERCGLQDSDLVHLRQMPCVERLYLARNPITSDGLEHLRGLARLERLSLWGTGVTDDGLEHLSGLPNLTVLDIHNPYGRVRTGTGSPTVALRPPLLHNRPRLTADCLRYLTDNTNLCAIYVSFPVDDEALLRLGKLPRLQLRSLILGDVSDEGLAALPGWPGLDAIFAERVTVGPQGLYNISRLPYLRRLWLNEVEAPDEAWRCLVNLRNLEELSLRGSSIDDNDIPHLGRLTKLKHLSLQDTEITDAGAASLSGLRNLQTLNLTNTQLSADCLQYLSQMKQLERLHFQAPLDDDAVGCLAQLPKLTKLMGRDSTSYFDFYLSDAGVLDLAGLNCVNYVILHDAREGAGLKGVDPPPQAQTITNTALAQLWKNRQFRAVQISGRDLTAAGLRWTSEMKQCRLVRLRSPRPALEVISHPLPSNIFDAEIHNNGLTVESGHVVGPRQVEFIFGRPGCQLGLLRHLPSIQQLTIGPNTARSSIVGDWDNLRFVPNLCTFLMPDRRNANTVLDSDGVRRLGEMTRMRTMAIHLPNDFPAKDLAPLSRLGQLASLDLHCGPLDAEHLRVVSQLTGLLTLRVFAQPRSVSDQQALRHLAQLKTLRELWLYGIADEGMAHVRQIKSLVRLTVEGQQITNDGLLHLDELPALQYLDARSTGITDQAFERFRWRHPDIYVRTDRPRRTN